MRFENRVLAFIPARGGSKSIPLKNMVSLDGRPLIDYVIKAAKASHSVSRVLCSTENIKIKEFCLQAGIETQERPARLCGDDVSTQDVVFYALSTLLEKEGKVAGMIALLEPTSPFLLSKHIDDCVGLLEANPSADSVQTLTPVPPNHHAYNQRFLEGGLIHFKFPEERRRFYNKQLKPKFYVHGNLRVFRSELVFEKKDIFGDRSLPYIIPQIYAMDVDGPEELKLAECILKYMALELP